MNKNKAQSLNESGFNKMLNSPISKKQSVSKMSKPKKGIGLNIKPPISKREKPSVQTNTKNTNTSIRQEQTQTAEISLSSTSTINSKNKKIGSRITSSKKYEIILKANEELMELQLKNSRLENDIMILNEKNRTLNNIINIKNTEYETLKNRYSNIINEITLENQNLKQNAELSTSKIKVQNEKHTQIIASLLTMLVNICDILLTTKQIGKVLNANNTNGGVEYSIDVYDSFNCEEERRVALIEQIQSLLLLKINQIKRVFGINIDQRELDKINNWTLNLTKRSSSRINTLNANQNEDICNSLSKIYVNSNDTSNDFDLSVSNQFYKVNNTNTTNKNNISASPKFNSFDEDKKQEDNNTLTANQNKNFNSSYQKSNLLSVLSELKSSSGSLGEMNSGNNSNSTNKFNEIVSNKAQSTNTQNCINILNYSIGDIINSEPKQENEDNQKLNHIESFADIQPCGSCIEEHNDNKSNGNMNDLSMKDMNNNLEVEENYKSYS